MAVREDLISSAITFLQDPSVANAPLDRRIAFLQAKNLTQEEIDISLARVGEAVSPQARQNSSPYQQFQQRQQPSPYGYGANQEGFWPQPPPEIPRRDWRDYFIMATVMGGVGYGLYSVAKRYVIPLIAPPTPPQLEQDKASIDEAFTRAFTLLDQLTTDTAAIKASEESRKERLDGALAEMESALQEMKASSRRRDDDSRRVGDEVRGLQSLIPKALKAQEEAADTRLKELTAELKSLKTLVANRMTVGAAGGAPPAQSMQGQVNGLNMFGPQGTASVNNGNSIAVNGSDKPTAATGATEASSTPTTASDRPASANAYSTYARFGSAGGGARGGIPAWQLAAAASNKKVEAQEGAKDEVQSSDDVNGTSEEAGR